MGRIENGLKPFLQPSMFSYISRNKKRFNRARMRGMVI
jgi:hypothetical protein